VYIRIQYNSIKNNRTSALRASGKYFHQILQPVAAEPARPTVMQDALQTLVDTQQALIPARLTR